jgi:hypothetical protein
VDDFELLREDEDLGIGTLLTRLNNYDIGVVIPESETLKEVLCPAKQDWMLQEPFTTLCSGGLKSAGS